MSTSTTDIEAFQQFLTEECSNDSTLTPESAVEKFRQLQHLRKKLADSRAASARGESGPLDVDAMMERVTSGVDAEGTPE